MSTESNRRWSRIDARMAEARQLLDLWIKHAPPKNIVGLDGCNHVLGRAQTSVRMLAAIVSVAHAPTQAGIHIAYFNAATEICEAIARERVP